MTVLDAAAISASSAGERSFGPESFPVPPAAGGGLPFAPLSALGGIFPAGPSQERPLGGQFHLLSPQPLLHANANCLEWPLSGPVSRAIPLNFQLFPSAQAAWVGREARWSHRPVRCWANDAEMSLINRRASTVSCQVANGRESAITGLGVLGAGPHLPKAHQHPEWCRRRHGELQARACSFLKAGEPRQQMDGDHV